MNETQKHIVRWLAYHGVLNWVRDEKYLSLLFEASIGKKPDFVSPVSFNEKLQWLKLYDRKPEYTVMVDKLKAKDYVADIIGSQYIIPTIGVWDSFDEIRFGELPDRFVLKCTHDSGGLVICEDKSKLDIRKARRKIERSLKTDYYLEGREWPYKNVPRKIIAEEFIGEPGQGLTDYKLMCFQGKVRCTFLCTERFSGSGLKVTFYDEDWNIMPFERHYPKAERPAPRPENFDEMTALAEKLSAGHRFLRVDFYDVAGKIYFGELTFFPGSGFEEFDPPEWDDKLGGWIDLGIPDRKKTGSGNTGHQDRAYEQK